MAGSESKQGRLLKLYKSAADKDLLLCQIELAERLVNLQPDGAVHWMRLGQCQTWATRFDLAEASLQRGLSIEAEQDGRSVCLRLLGAVSEAKGEFAAARERYLQSHALRPDNASPLCDLGRMLLHQGRTSEARPILMQAIECSHGMVAASLLVLSSICAAEGRDDESRSWAQLAQARDPKCDATRTRLDDLDACRDLTPQDDKLLEWVSDAVEGRLEDARSWAERAIEIDPDYQAAHLRLADLDALRDLDLD